MPTLAIRAVGKDDITSEIRENVKVRFAKVPRQKQEHDLFQKGKN